MLRVGPRADHAKDPQRCRSTFRIQEWPTKKYSSTAILKSHPVAAEAVADAIYEAGCDDSLVGASDDWVKATFHRSAADLAEAVRSANHDVRNAGYGTHRIELNLEESGLLAEAI